MPETAPPHEHPEAQLAELRRLLLAPEQQELEDLRHRLSEFDLRTEDVASVIAEAIVLRTRRDALLARALQPTIEEAIRLSVKQNPKMLVDAIYPVIGPAIRQSIQSALSGMVSSMNSVLERSVSPQSFAWRLEAWRTGKSFAEVVLLRSLVYRVEQALLIHRATSLPVLEVHDPQAVTQDADLVSGMLSAIRDFAQDSFGLPQGGALETIRMGELTVLVEEGPLALLAVAVRGTPPADLATVLREQLEMLHLRAGEELRDFAGDSAPLEGHRGALEACLVSQYDAREARKIKESR